MGKSALLWQIDTQNWLGYLWVFPRPQLTPLYVNVWNMVVLLQHTLIICIYILYLRRDQYCGPWWATQAGSDCSYNLPLNFLHLYLQLCFSRNVCMQNLLNTLMYFMVGVLSSRVHKRQEFLYCKIRLLSFFLANCEGISDFLNTL